jgi:hypothetical protein
VTHLSDAAPSEDAERSNRDDVLRKVVHGLNEANHQQGRKVTFALLDIPHD